jgi:hypothetical protein
MICIILLDPLALAVTIIHPERPHMFVNLICA